MAEHYESPTMSFMLDVGLRTAEDKMWHYLKDLAHSAVWLMGGAYTRHSRGRRGPLPQRIAQAQGARKGQGRAPSRDAASQQLTKEPLLHQCLDEMSDVAVGSTRDEAASILPARLQGLLRGFLTAPGPITIWANPFWRAMFGRWSMPHEQHDVAEFLQCVAEFCPTMVQSLGMRRESRTQESGILETRDLGNSLPPSISPSNGVLSGRVGTSVQRLIDDWSQQADVHAALSEPRVLIVQAGRSRQDEAGHANSKWGYDVILDRVVWFPVFTNGLPTRSIRLKLCSFVVHRGPSLHMGHYQAILYVDAERFLADDNVVARPCTAIESSGSGVDSYFFVYSRA